MTVTIKSILILITCATLTLPTAYAQSWRDIIVGDPKVQTATAQKLNLSDACKPGPASMQNMPRWKDVKQKNRGYYRPLGSSASPAPYSATVPGGGVPDLDNPANNLTVGQSVRNMASLFSNAVNVINTAGQVPFAQPANGKVGIGICKKVGSGDGVVLVDPARNYCDYVTACQAKGMSTFLWIPEDLDFLHDLRVGGGMHIWPKVYVSGEKNLWEFAQDVEINFDDANKLPKHLKKWTLHLVEILDTWNSSKLNNFKDGFASKLSAQSKKYSNWWGSFEKGQKQVEATINRYMEGYHLGAYDQMRPDLHLCVGYYGHQTDNTAVAMFGGRLNLGSAYNSWNLSTDLRAQMRTGGMELEFVNKKTGAVSNLPLLPTPEFNIQYDGLKAWNCDDPFGSGHHLCPTSPANLPNVSAQGQCQSANYLSFENLGEGTDKFQVGLMKDFYPVHFGGNDVVWPRREFGPQLMNAPLSPWDERKIMVDDLPSSAVMSSGLNLGFDFGLPDPAPRTLARFSIGPVPAVLQWDLDYGVRWVHDSNYMLNKVSDGLKSSGSTYPIAEIFERNMHPMQANDVTADNGQELYVKPSLFLGAGLTVSRRNFGFEALIDMGLHVDIEPGFYAGIADMSVAMKEAMEAIGDVNGTCEPVYAAKPINGAVLCSADVYADEIPAYMRALKKLELQRQGAVDQSKPPKLLDKEDTLFYCGTKPKYDAKTQGSPTLKACASRGYCTDQNGKRTKHDVTKADCLNAEKKTFEKGEPFETFTAYSCKGSKKTDIVGWKGPGCSPLLEGAGFPTAPGGICKPPYRTLTVNTQLVLNPDGSVRQAGNSRPQTIKVPQQQCNSGLSCVEGACLTSCSTSADCGDGYVCNPTQKACVNASGISYIEQIIWRKNNPKPAEPLHSVWSHSVNQLEAKVDFSIGARLKVWIKVFKKRFEKSFAKDLYWNLANKGWVDYKIGVSADYANQCAASVGTVDVKQQLPRISAGQFSNSQALVNACLNDMPTDVLPVTGPPCQPDETPNQDGMCGLPNEDNIGDSIESGLEWAQTVGEGMWDEYEAQMCIAGMPWQDWIKHVSDPKSEEPLGVTVLADGRPVGVVSASGRGGEDLERNIANASGCLRPSGDRASQAITKITGLDRNGNIRIFEFLADPAGGAVPSNIRAPLSSADEFNAWYDKTEQCLEGYIEGRGERPSAITFDMDFGPCPGVDATLINVSSPNDDIKPAISTPIRTPVRRPTRTFRNVPAQPRRAVKPEGAR